MATGWSNRGRNEGGRFVSQGESQYLGYLYARQASERLLRDVRIQVGLKVSDQVYNRLYEGLYTWVKVIGQEEATDAAFEEMHAKLADEIQDKIVRAYKRTQRADRKSYRWDDPGKLRRFSNKAMLKALQSESLVEHDAHGIYFPNKKILDESAKQWYRLNFGAKPATTPTPTWGNMKFGTRPGYPTKTNVNFNSFKPSKGFMVPQLSPGSGARGIWSKAHVATSWGNFKSIRDGYTGAFSPSLARRSALYVIPPFTTLGFERRKSKGIVGTRFIDEGARHLNNRYGQEVSKILDEWRRKANKAGKAVAERRGQFEIAPTATPPAKVFTGAAGSLDTSSPQAFLESGGDPDAMSRGEFATLLRQWGLTSRQFGSLASDFGL
jgi:hypothetical protein